MVLFSKNPIRSAAIAAVVVSVAHYATKFLSSIAFQLTQTSIAILSISALLFMIMMHHKMEGKIMTQSQEEMAVIGIFALFWVAFLIGYQSIKGKQGGTTTGSAVATDLGFPKVSQGSPSWQDPCLGDGVYCVYEEYTYF